MNNQTPKKYAVVDAQGVFVNRVLACCHEDVVLGPGQNIVEDDPANYTMPEKAPAQPAGSTPDPVALQSEVDALKALVQQLLGNQS